MPLPSRWTLTLSLVLGLVWMPAAAADDAPLPPAAGAASPFAEEGPSYYVVGIGDAVAVRVFGHDQFKGEYRVDDEGRLDLPWIGKVQADGQTLAQLNRRITEVLAADYLREPQVTVDVTEYRSQPVQVLGAIKRSDTYYLQGPTRLLDLLAMAGGVETAKASSEVHVSRKVGAEPHTLVIDLERLMSAGESNIRLSAGDVVNVQEGRVFYVGGEVAKPGEVPWKGGVTVTRALAMAGGSKGTANLRRATVIRATGEKVLVNIRRIQKGKDADVVMQAGDQLFVGESPF